jgi:heme-degrading monooxygenase HmoA
MTVLPLPEIFFMEKNFVAVNYITCSPEYRGRFEELFSTRAHAIDKMPGFIEMHVLKPNKEDDNYLIVSYWENENSFKSWTQSEAFLEGHKRGFADIAAAKAEGKPAPMSSDFKTYKIIAR